VDLRFVRTVTSLFVPEQAGSVQDTRAGQLGVAMSALRFVQRPHPSMLISLGGATKTIP
jgi:hypothetical protein